MTEHLSPLDDILELLQARVEEHRRDGTYPADLDEQLGEHYHQLKQAQTGVPLGATARLEEHLQSLGDVGQFEARRASLESRLPGGALAHRMAARLTVRHVDELRRQLAEYSTGVSLALSEILKFQEGIAEAVQDLAWRVSEGQALSPSQRSWESELERRVAELRGHLDAPLFSPWFSNDEFEAAFRGSQQGLRARYEDLAARLEGCAPVLDIGCGRGEFLELLRDRGVSAQGVELDAALVRDCQARGLDVARADGLQTLEQLPDQSLGGMALIQVIEHLSPQQAADLAPLAASKLRPGGCVIIETINPLSLYVFGHALYLDPTHLRLVHPLYLEFLFRKAGFAETEIEWRSPPDAAEQLSELPGTEPLAERLNPIVRRLNEVLFGPQDYALIATR